MKTFRPIRIIFTTILFCLCVSCQKTSNRADGRNISAETNYETDVSLTITSSDKLSASINMGIVSFAYSAETDNGRTSSKLISGKGGEQVETDFILDENLDGFKFDLHNKVVEQANKLLSTFTTEEIRYITGQYEIFGRKILSSKEIIKTSPLAQSIYFHNAVLNVVNRSLQNGEECNCTPDPAYYVNKGPFFCQEDLKINTKAVLAIVQNVKTDRKDEIEKIADYIRAHASEDEISIDRLYGLFETKKSFQARVAKYNAFYKGARTTSSSSITGRLDATAYTEEPDCQDGPSGSDIGCCGNYSGCCWLSAGLCLAHDIICWCCDDWYCLWGCEPEASC
ncbi:hypothetical protein [Olivibacter sp. XZL3]|uniref:hypothetical protein n=1 Tax=Olivibacter sp. XZL3 TaxID=1735116 RepID=UPI0010671264|nr:hypothetical protein [Olivibacter sp. XZL3]